MQDYEVTVINDGSYDNTGEVLQTLADIYGARLQIITHAKNLGSGALSELALARRCLLEAIRLTSTSGAICVELV